MKRKIAMYVRLSNEDTHSGSASLENQEKIIREKLDKLPEYDGFERVLFCDNGYSGRNLDRPALNELLSLVKQQEIACICIKDFSRLSRDMLQVGYLVESVLPLFQTRLISVTDHHDTNDFYEDTGGINVTFKYLMAEFYSRDLSKKITAGKRARMKRGQHVLKIPLFGYKLDENRKFIIDEPAAEIVRFIFQLSLEGKTTAEIRSTLYEQNIPTRSEYKKDVLGVTSNQVTMTKGLWERSSITELLRNEQYIGTYISGRRKALADGSGKDMEMPESEWIKIPHHHPPIVEETTFRQVQENLQTRVNKSGKTATREHFLKGKVFCAVCQHKMQWIPFQGNYFACITSRDIPDLACSGTRITEEEILSTVYPLLKDKAKKIMAMSVEETSSEVKDVAGDIIKEKRKLYEQLSREEITLDQYKEMKREVERVEEEWKQAQQYTSVQAEGRKKQKSDLEQCLEYAKKLKFSKKPNREMIDKLIEKVSVFPDTGLEITFMYQIFEDM